MRSNNLKQRSSAALSIILLLLCLSFSVKPILFSGLPSSGEITMNMIRSELGVHSQTNFSLNAARSGAYAPLNPYSPSLPPRTGQVKLSDWYGYCHTCTTLYPHTVYYKDAFAGGFSSESDACSGTRSYPITVYSSSPSLGAGATLYTLSSNVYYPFIVDDTDQWIYSNTGSKPIQMNGSNTISATSSCTLTLYWTFDNAAGSVYTNLYIYKNGVMAVSRMFSDSGSFSFDAGDNVRVYLAKSGTDGYTNIVDITGGSSFNSSNNSDTDIDSGTFTPGGILYVTATVHL